MKRLSYLAGGLAAIISVISCGSEDEFEPRTITYGDAGNDGTAGAGGTPKYPEILNEIETHTSEPVTKLVDCIIKKNYELQNSGKNKRAGIVMMGSKGCSWCEEEVDAIGQEGAYKLADEGIYIDPSFNYDSKMRAKDVGFLSVPTINIIQIDPFPTADNPEGETFLVRKWDYLATLGDLADLTGCDYKPD